MNLTFKRISIGVGMACLLISVARTEAFALLGPYEPWMQATNGFRQPESIYTGDGQIQPADIGGPMNLTNEYRWNVPVITYGFDQSFLDYFGTNGMSAVTSAIQILNDLPPASSIVLTNFPLVANHYNDFAQSESLYDLKSQTLSSLLEQLGLTQPARYTFVLRQWDSSLLPDSNEISDPLTWPAGAIPEFILRRNFDPQTLERSSYVDETLFTASIVGFSDGSHVMTTFPLDLLAQNFPSVADLNQSGGEYYTGLTYDDVGGLSYLLSTNNVNYESLLPGVYGVGASSNSFVNGAWRPGVDKITFVPQPVDSSGSFIAYTNYYTDSYLTNGVLVQQQVARVLTKPDILFSAADFGNQSASPQFRRTGTTNWINNAALNGNAAGAGPGVIQPGITITFNKAGRMLEHDPSLADESVYDFGSSSWASFDASTNAPVLYPVAKSGTNQFTVHMWLVFGNSSQQHFEWSPVSLIGTQFAFQTSTNLIDWTTSFIATNDGNVCTYFNQSPASQSRFYRLIPSAQ